VGFRLLPCDSLVTLQTCPRPFERQMFALEAIGKNTNRLRWQRTPVGATRGAPPRTNIAMMYVLGAAKPLAFGDGCEPHICNCLAAETDCPSGLKLASRRGLPSRWSFLPGNHVGNFGEMRDLAACGVGPRQCRSGQQQPRGPIEFNARLLVGGFRRNQI